MLETYNDRRTGRHRVAFEKYIRFVPPGNEKCIWVQAHNLSEAGIFISSAELFTVGTEVFCDVPLPDQEIETDTNLALRGKVAWIKNRPYTGMGIEFMDLSDIDLSLLRQIVSHGKIREPNCSVKVWFEGLPQPIRAQAIRFSDGISLKSELPFLRLSSPVLLNLGNAAEETYTGVLEGVRLLTDHAHPTPWLQVDIRSIQPNQTMDSIGLNGSPTEEEEDTPETVLPKKMDQQTRAEPSPPYYEETSYRDFDTFRTPIPNPIEEKELFPDFDKELFAPIILDEDKLESPKIDNDTTLTLSKNNSKRRHPGLWVAAILMSGVAVASMGYTHVGVKFWNKIVASVTATTAHSFGLKHDINNGPTEENSKALSMQPSTIQLSTDNHAELQPSIPPSMLEPTEAPVDDSLPQQQPSTHPRKISGSLSLNGIRKHEPSSSMREPHCQKIGDKVVLNIPFLGSTKGETNYRLSDPDALVVNLPQATPTFPFGDYLLKQDKLRKVWIRKRPGGGLHVRLFFKGEPPMYKLDAEKKMIQLTVDK